MLEWTEREKALTKIICEENSVLMKSRFVLP
jgi:hypothetical protein